MKKFLWVFSFLVLAMGFFVKAGGNACMDNFTTCTEGGCGTLEIAWSCKVKCLLSTGKPVDVKCGYPPKPAL